MTTREREREEGGGQLTQNLFPPSAFPIFMNAPEYPVSPILWHFIRVSNEPVYSLHSTSSSSSSSGWFMPAHWKGGRMAKSSFPENHSKAFLPLTRNHAKLWCLTALKTTANTMNSGIYWSRCRRKCGAWKCSLHKSERPRRCESSQERHVMLLPAVWHAPTRTMK